jgi:hydrogenase maturation protein HypF
LLPAFLTKGNHIIIVQIATYHIHITGLVQGVGFRPFLYQLAVASQLHGWVKNSSDGVHIEINATEAMAGDFYRSVLANVPDSSVITSHSMQETGHIPYSSFSIAESSNSDASGMMLTPDYAICAECIAEMNDPLNRRYHYPFITCTHCGPRYSIIYAIPYDRCNTSMQSFPMCEDCTTEYNDPGNRRHYAQTNSCPDCGVSLSVCSGDSDIKGNNPDITIEEVVRFLQEGKIVAVKGIGGYLLLCDATSETVIKRLRERKQRPAKPFALLYAGMACIKQDFDVSQQEAESLQSPVTPIVLLQQKKHTVSELAGEAIAPGLSSLGVMLPAAPLLQLIADQFAKPLIATSANISGSQIIFSDKDALEHLTAIADYILAHNREILIPQDDSVVKFSPLHQQQIILRRSRGLSPSFFGYTTKHTETILATGALLKSGFTYSLHNNIYTSQYLGNTISYEAQQAYRQTVAHFNTLFNPVPQLVLADKHPAYFAHEFALEQSMQHQCPLITIQHHKAHAAAILGEHDLVTSDEPVLCVVWDGTGLGDDGNIWGGEFFRYHNNNLQRSYYFDYFPILAGDKMAKEPRLAALAACSDAWMEKDMLQNKFTPEEWKLYTRLLDQQPSLYCSSVGRIFDAVASLLGLCDRQSYEGQAAMLLEEAARTYFEQEGYQSVPGYFMDGAHYHRIPTASLMSNIAIDISKGLSVPFIAAKFHCSLVHLVAIVARNLHTHKITFSGGVFQNGLLTDLLREHLGSDFQLYFHKNLSPNDENISFGQLVYYDQDIDGCRTLNRAGAAAETHATAPSAY